jgi:hypothetical protein
MNCCFGRTMRLRVESKMVEVVLSQVGYDDLNVGIHWGTRRIPASFVRGENWFLIIGHFATHG